MGLGIMATINQNLEPETIELLAEDYGKQVRFVTAEDKLRSVEVEDKEKDLIEVSNLLLRHVRKGDLLSRLGGDEFVIILPETKVEDAENRANDLG